MENKALATFKDEENGVEARVFEVESGFSVAMHDVDSGQTVPCYIIFKTKEAAIAKAKELI